jgi:hypothetical protein
LPGNVLSVRDAPLLGLQTPRILWAPEAPTSAAGEAIELAADCGLHLDPWQQLVLHHALGEKADGSWAAFEVGLTVPRQNGKSAVLEARILAGLLLFGEELITYSAHEFRTAMEIMRRLETLLISSGEKFMPTTSHGQEGFEMGTVKRRGQRVLFQSRTKAAGLGTSGDCIILDEAMWLAPEAIGVLMPTMAARPNPQLWYAGSAVDKEMHPKGYVFSGVRARGIDGHSPRLCYIEWSPEDDADRSDPAVWAGANPGMGFRPGFTVEYVADEFEAMHHTPKMFDVMRAGIGDWPTMDSAALRPIPAHNWNGMAKKSAAELVGSPALAIDRSPNGAHWTIAAAQRTAAGRIHLEIGPYEFASNLDVIEKVVQIVGAWDPVAVVIDSKSPAAALQHHLLAAGVEPTITSLSDLVLACSSFVDDALSGHLSHSEQPDLTAAVLSAVKRKFSGGFVWDRTPKVLVTPLVAATLAHWGLLAFSKPPKHTPVPMSDKPETSPNRRSEQEFDAMSAPF